MSIYCTNCGAECLDDQKFCTKCGESLILQDTVVSNEPEEKPKKKSKKKIIITVVVGVIALFLIIICVSALSGSKNKLKEPKPSDYSSITEYQQAVMEYQHQREAEYLKENFGVEDW